MLSNNDGCVVARSQEAKDLGIKMGEPAFQLESLFEKHHVHVFSSNYTLYGDMSHRVMKTLSAFSPEVEIYSIDEAFLSLRGMGWSLIDYGREIRATVFQNVGLPVGVGIGPTKTLAKVSNCFAKKESINRGVFQIISKKRH